jgi:hypothetical protein
MAITVKKKTLKLKKTGQAPAAEAAPEAPAETPAAAPEDEPVIAAVVQRSPQGRPASYMFAAICGIIATLLLGALVAIQFIENSYYRSAIPIFRP